MKTARVFNGWLRISTKDEARTILNTTRPIEEELFATLKYYSEIKSVGTAFMKNLGHTKSKENWLLFQSFIRQSESFYQSANSLNYRAAALMYYYGFLNLAKGLICLHDPNFVTNPVKHGLSHRFKKSSFLTQYISIDKHGIFPKVYELLTNQESIGNANLNITKMLGYSLDISHEYFLTKLGKRPFCNANICLLNNTSKKSSWSMLAIANFENLKMPKKFFQHFSKHYEVVNLELTTAREIFNIYAEGYRYYTFFESKQEYSWENGKIKLKEIRQDIRDALTGLYEPDPYDNQSTLIFFSPLKTDKGNLFFNQTLSIYATMFYLGSLVRYRPDYLEHLLNSKEAWIIERFTKSASITFLRLIVNYILSKEYIFVSK